MQTETLSYADAVTEIFRNPQNPPETAVRRVRWDSRIRELRRCIKAVPTIDDCRRFLADTFLCKENPLPQRLAACRDLLRSLGGYESGNSLTAVQVNIGQDVIAAVDRARDVSQSAWPAR